MNLLISWIQEIPELHAYRKHFPFTKKTQNLAGIKSLKEQVFDKLNKNIQLIIQNDVTELI